MTRFVSLLEERTNQIDEQILDMVESFSDFLAFKRIILAYKEYIQNEENFKDLAIKSNRITWFLISIQSHYYSHIINHHAGLVFRKIGLFTFFNEPIELNELTPIPPKVKTGILKSP